MRDEKHSIPEFHDIVLKTIGIPKEEPNSEIRPLQIVQLDQDCVHRIKKNESFLCA